MHDRRVAGETLVFGNAGGLYMRAMTWYDHDTQSIWSQPLGEAISGSLKGTQIPLRPSQVTTWANWVQSYPDSLALITDIDVLAGFRQRFEPNFVIGLVLEDQARAYYYEDLLAAGILNDRLGPFPVLVWAGQEDFRAYLRRYGEQVLTFRREGDQVVDQETGTVWDLGRGLAISGPLKGQALQSVPSLTAYDWAWIDFYPDGSFFEFEKGGDD